MSHPIKSEGVPYISGIIAQAQAGAQHWISHSTQTGSEFCRVAPCIPVSLPAGQHLDVDDSSHVVSVVKLHAHAGASSMQA